MASNKQDRISLVKETNTKRKSEKKGNIFSYPLYGRLLFYLFTAKKTKFLRADIEAYIKPTTWSNSTKFVLRNDGIIIFQNKKGGKNEFDFETNNFRNKLCKEFIEFYNDEIIAVIKKSMYQIYRRRIKNKKSNKDLIYYRNNLKKEFQLSNFEYNILEFSSRPENIENDNSKKLYAFLKEKEELGKNKTPHPVLTKTTENIRRDINMIEGIEPFNINETDTKDSIALLELVPQKVIEIGNLLQAKGKDYSMYDIFREIVTYMGAEYRNRQNEIERGQSSLLKKLYQYANLYQNHQFWNWLN